MTVKPTLNLVVLHTSSPVCCRVCHRSSWTKFTQDNLNQALQEEEATNRLRSELHRVGVENGSRLHSNLVNLLVFVRVLVEQLLLDTTEDLRAQCSSVEEAFSQRCVELMEAKTQLEMKLAKVDRQTARRIPGLTGNCSSCVGRSWSRLGPRRGILWLFRRPLMTKRLH